MPSTPDQLARKFEKVAIDIGTFAPKRGMIGTATVALTLLKAGANRGKPPGGGSIAIKRTVGAGPTAYTEVKGWGWAQLAESGSYKHPDGWSIYPKGVSKKTGQVLKPRRSREGSSLRGISQKALRQARYLGYTKAILGDPSTGFAAAYVTRHPPIPARPYTAAARAATARAAGGIFDQEVLKSLALVF